MTFELISEICLYISLLSLILCVACLISRVNDIEKDVLKLKGKDLNRIIQRKADEYVTNTPDTSHNNAQEASMGNRACNFTPAPQSVIQNDLGVLDEQAVIKAGMILQSEGERSGICKKD